MFNDMINSPKEQLSPRSKSVGSRSPFKNIPLRASLVSDFSNKVSMFKAAKHVRVTLGKVAANKEIT